MRVWDEFKENRKEEIKTIMLKALPYGVGAAIILVLLDKTIGMGTLVTIATSLWSLRIVLTVLFLAVTVTLAVIAVGGAAEDQWSAWRTKKATKAKMKLAAANAKQPKLTPTGPAPPLRGLAALRHWVADHRSPTSSTQGVITTHGRKPKAR